MRSAFAYYEACSDGLGSGFVEELNTAVDYLEEHSEPGPAYDADIRRILLRRFPYGVFYTIEKERIVVHAILDLRMNPSGMRERFN